MNYKDYGRHLLEALLIGLKWIGFGILCGILVGGVSAKFANGIVLVTKFRTAHPQILYLLPLAGLFIIAYYRLLGVKQPKGTNLVLSSIREGEAVPGRMAPLIILSTILTHLFGGSAGREGAALQVGGSMGDALGRLVRIPQKDRRTVIICGMSASFSALFGTPLAAAILSMEISTVGIMYYSSLVPAVISALTAHLIAQRLGVTGEAFPIPNLPVFGARTALITILFSIGCAVVSVLFCTVMHRMKRLMQHRFPNSYLRVLVASAVVIVLTLLVGDQTYNGTGAHILEQCMTEPGFRIVWYAFLLKILFTAVTLSGGFQGGEIVPSLFIGATFGNSVAAFSGLDPAFLSALGMCAVFCGVTNCPMAALLISFELFGFGASSFFLIAVAITYLFSGNYGLYASQKILYSKLEHSRVDRFTH